MPQTLFEKVWSRHVVLEKNGTALLYVDRHLLHEGSRRAFEILDGKGLDVLRPGKTFATADHYVPTEGRAVEKMTDTTRRDMVELLDINTRRSGIAMFGMADDRQGIVHVIGPELGLTLPGMTLVCGDSHTATHGALGALAFGIGASEVAHVLANQSVWMRKPKQMKVTVTGQLRPGLTAKDLILAIIAKIGTGGAAGHAIEYAGEAITSLSIEGRLTLCNMSIEAGARTGMIAPDETTFAYIKGRPYAPEGAAWDAAMSYWRTLFSDADAHFDTEVELDGMSVAPMITWGTAPDQVVSIDGVVPDPAAVSDRTQRDTMERALQYMGLTAGSRVDAIAFDRVFIGSCTNSRIEDLRMVAAIANGRKAVLPSIVVPGSTAVRVQAEAEGIADILIESGFEWRQSGCSMCAALNGDFVGSGERCASTTNRNFVGRQGRGARTHLVSPALAAAVAVTGRVVDPALLTGSDTFRSRVPS